MEDYTITILVKNVYGNETYYPQNFQEQLGALTGCKTLTAKHIHALSGMGFKFKIVHNLGLSIEK